MAQPRAKRVVSTRERLNMRIPRDLLAWTKAYVQRKNTTLTQDYIDFLTKRREREDAENA